MFTDVRESAAFRRLHALVRRGYRPEIGSVDVTDVIWLTHPGRGIRTLILYHDGMVVEPVTGFDDDGLRISGDDERQFWEFIRRTPVPTWWEQTSDTRIKIIVYGLMYGFAICFGLVANAALGIAVSAVRSLT
jgi:hypothetical protein